jgi:hypothetical protein
MQGRRGTMFYFWIIDHEAGRFHQNKITWWLLYHAANRMDVDRKFVAMSLQYSPMREKPTRV